MSGRTTTGERMLGGLGREAWDGLVGRSFYSSAAWLAFCETDFGDGSEAVVVEREGEPACAIPFVEVRDPDGLLAFYRWHDVLTGHGLPAPPREGLLVGPREGYQTHVLSPAGRRPSTSDLEALVGRLRAIHADGGDPASRACVAMYVTTPDALALQRAGVTATPVLLGTDAWIEVPEEGWEAWEGALSANRRSKVRQEVRRFREAGYRVEQLALAECWEELGPLACATQGKYGHEPELDQELRALWHHVECMGEAARVAVCRIDDGPRVGFCLYYVWKDTVFLRWSGFDYERLAGAAEYFNLCFYAQVELASTLGLRWLHAGIQSADAKALRGAELRPLWLVDLAEDSVLAGSARRIRRHNARRYELLKADRRTEGALVDREAWEAFL